MNLIIFEWNNTKRAFYEEFCIYCFLNQIQRDSLDI